MTAYPAWTPASRPGIIPLHPLSFGTILGRSFVGAAPEPARAARLRARRADARLPRRPGGDRAASRSRRSRASTRCSRAPRSSTRCWRDRSRSPRSPASCSVSAAGALGVIVQGIVVTEVAHAAVAEKLTLGGLWQQRQARRLAAHRLRVPARARRARRHRRRRARRHRRGHGGAARGHRRSPSCSCSPRSRWCWWLSTKLLLTPGGDHPRARDDRPGDRALVAAGARPLLGRARRHPRHLDHLQRRRAGDQHPVHVPVDRA